ncbi:MAG TPA: serine/threonine-protein kinase, partial [Vicinamibacteria bacterium]|nr:serine/threonine-protein kinase [Vicinamibacteria bacterium]
MHQKERPSRPAGEATPSPARGPEAGGRRVVAGRYELHEVLGEGGFAVSHRALDRRTGQACVVKEVLYRKIEDPKVLDLLEREARVLAHLSHPRIPRFVEYFAERLDGETRLYLVQEYVAGRSLAQWARDGRHFDEREVIRIGLQVGRILEHLHGLRPPIIHRDVKPGNVVLGADGEAWLVDFGAVRDRILHEIRTEGEAATIVGTYGYMPFEQFQGRALPASDIYALGMTLVFLLSHKEPHEIEAVSGRFELEPHARASPGLLRVVRRMIEPKPEDRHASATELCAELEALLGAPERRAPRPRRQWLAGAGLAAAALGMVVWSLVPSKPRSAPTQPSAQPRPREVISAVPARRPHVQVLYGLSIKGR